MSAFLCERDRQRGHQHPLSGASVICIKVMQPAANDNHWPWKGSWENPGPGSRVWREKETGQEPKKRQQREVMHWLSLATRVRYSARDPVCARMCAARPCSSVPCLDRRSAWLCCHSSPLMKGTRDDGKARWRHRQVELAKSSTQGDGKVIALIKWLWLVSGAFVNHYPSAIVPRVNHNKLVRGDNQEAPLLIIVP